MAHLNTFAPHIAGSSIGQIIMDTIADMKARRAQRAIYLRTLDTLSSMSDRDLADIGVSRLAIRDIARTAAYPK